MASTSTGNIKVVCRFRPQNAIEKKENGTIVIDVDEDGRTCNIEVMDNYAVIMHK